MRYFFLSYLLAGFLVVGFLGKRGEKFSSPPAEFFPDMDAQDKLKEQDFTLLFKDGMGGRNPLKGTVPLRLDDMEFSRENGYYFSGKRGESYGDGLPDKLKEQDFSALIYRGKERFEIYCAVCHGSFADGGGTVSRYGLSGIANLMQDFYLSNQYSDGKFFEVISKGKGNMGAYGHQIPVKDRWAIIAYVRSLQESKKSKNSSK